MGSFANAFEKKILDHVFGGSAYSQAATLYLGLSTTTIGIDGSNITEPSTSYNYARVSLTNTTASWATATTASNKGQKLNAGQITFNAATAGAWGTVTDWFITSEATGGTAGNVLVYGALTSSRTIAIGDTAKVATGAITITLD